MAREFPELTFKGGTCLNKAYFGYYRLSEDLDFVLPLDASRTVRAKRLSNFKDAFTAAFRPLGLEPVPVRSRHNEDRQGTYFFTYGGLVDGNPQNVQVDVTLRALALPPVARPIASVFMDPVLLAPVFPGITVACMDLREAMAEKLRAAMTRPEPAIRDFYDLAYVRRHAPDFDFEAIRPLVRVKLEESKFAYTYRDKLEFLRSRIRPELAPVVRDADSFDLDAAFRFVAGFEA